MKSKLWLIGSGIMSLEYSKVLKAQNINFLVIGRGERSAAEFESKTNIPVIRGGLDNFLKTKPEIPDQAIVSVGCEGLKNTSVLLIKYGVKFLLVEKPGGMNLKEIKELRKLSHKNKCHIYVAYNRRFYASVLKAQDIIKEDGGVKSFNFEFTEWSHEIEKLEKAPGVKENWFLNNSTHVVDLAFYLGGHPEKICSFIKDSLEWHSRSAVFAGAGLSDKKALFSYQANWQAPGRWGVEILTSKHRLIFRPLEKLQIQNIGSVKIEFLEINDKLDLDYKPGLYKQVEYFLTGKTKDLCTIDKQYNLMPIYNKIAGY